MICATEGMLHVQQIEREVRKAAPAKTPVAHLLHHQHGKAEIAPVDLVPVALRDGGLHPPADVAVHVGIVRDELLVPSRRGEAAGVVLV